MSNVLDNEYQEGLFSAIQGYKWIPVKELLSLSQFVVCVDHPLKLQDVQHLPTTVHSSQWTLAPRREKSDRIRTGHTNQT